MIRILRWYKSLSVVVQRPWLYLAISNFHNRRSYSGLFDLKLTTRPRIHTDLIKSIFSINSQQAAVEIDNIVIEEGGEFVKERIVLDKKRGISIYHTGDHCGRDAVTELVDSNFVSC